MFSVASSMCILEFSLAKALARAKVKPEGDEIESEPESDNPFYNRCYIFVIAKLGPERYGQDDEDKCEHCLCQVSYPKTADIRAEFFVQPAKLFKRAPMLLALCDLREII